MTRRAFTLVELMVVIAIMAVMATMSVSGYRALSKGMKDRAALTAVQTFLDGVRQRAEIDRKTVFVFIYDDLLRKGDGSDVSGHGVAVAVRAVGRFSAVEGDRYLCDEFGDLDKVYASENALAGDMSANKSSKTQMRIYAMKGAGGYAEVRTSIIARSFSADYILTGQGLPPGDDSSGGKQVVRHAFELVGGGSGFNAGDAYGAEFASVELPEGYYFGSSVPKEVGRADVATVTVTPGGSVSGGGIPVRAMNSAGSLEDVGSAKVSK